MIFHRRGLLFLIGLALTGTMGVARDDTLSKRVREPMQGFVDRNEIAGAVTLIGDRDTTLSLEAVGLRDVEGNQPMKTDTLFRIASMTKPITALGVMMLVDEGKVDLDAPVATYLPEFRGQQRVTSRGAAGVTLADPARPASIRDLLTHTSGLPDAPPPGHVEPAAAADPSLAGMARRLATRPLDFEPGSRWAYSNAGVNTLGRVIEVVAGVPYEVYLRERLFGPLGMTDTTFYPTAGQMARAAVVYDRKDGKLVADPASRVAPTPATRYPNPAGGLFSTAPDLARFDAMLLHRGHEAGRRYLSESCLGAMTATQTGGLKTGFTEGMSFGLGVGVVRTPAGVTALLSPGSFGHGGAFGTQNWVDPRKGRYAVLLIQRLGLGNNDDTALRREFQQAALGVPNE